MAETPHAFTLGATKRIAKAVRKTEKLQSIGTNDAPLNYLPTLYARLVAQDTTDTSMWSWQQVIRKDDGSYEDGPLKGELDSTNKLHFPAYALNGEQAAVGFRVILNRIAERQDDGSLLLKYTFAAGASLPTGEFQGMCFMNVTQNQMGNSYLFFHELV